MREELINRTTYSTSKALEIYSVSYLWPYEVVLLDSYLKAGMKVLDIGCGTGRSTRFIAERGGQVVGIDMVEAFINKGKELYPDLDLRVMNATRLDFPDQSFDLVLFSNQGIDYTDRREVVIQEACRVLRSHGIFAYSAHNSLSWPRTRKAWRNFFLNFRSWRFGYHFRVEHHPNGDLHVAHNNVWAEIRLLQRVGFRVIEILSNHSRFSSWPKLLVGLFTRWPLYVCRKN